MSDKNDTHYKSEQDDNGTVSKGSARTATAGKSSTSKSDASQKHISSGKKIKKAGVNLTPVESLLFFNIVRFNKDPGNGTYPTFPLWAWSLEFAEGSRTCLLRL